MKKYLTYQYLIFLCCIFFTACNTATPEKYFNLAVLNSNMLNGFAGDGQLRQLESPSAKMDANGAVVAIKRTEELNNKIQYLEESFKKLKALQENEDAKSIVQTSVALYEFVLPVYKTEYSQLAALYDKGADKGEIQALSQSIHDKYFNQYEALYNKLIGFGKVYAEKHSIKVNWGVD